MFQRLVHALSRYVGYARAAGPVGFSRWACARSFGSLARGRVITLRTPGLSGPVVVRLGSSDLQVFRQIFLAKEYEPTLAHIDADNVSSILDCSANIGLAAVYCLAHCPRAVLVAIEPDGGNVALLEANLRRFGARATVTQAGVWSGGGTLGVRAETRGVGAEWSRQLERVAEDAHDGIQAVGPDELLALGRGYVDLLKVDIEGAEVELFRPDPRWLERAGAVVIELHDDTPFGPARVAVRPDACDEGADEHEAA